ncbi:MAG: TolC family protein, partial [Flavobacteriales bacterium]|nr:TolC family protein [Flavobacteriales bacterium]
MNQRVMMYRLFLFFMLIGDVLSAQDVLTRDEALNLALQHNYNIQVAQKNVETAKSNASVFNSGFLPHANISAGGNINYSAGENETVQGTQSFDATAAYSYNGSVGITHTIFNGLGRWYNFKQLMETHNLSKLQAQQIMENTAVQLSSAYFQIAQLSETVGILEQSLTISKKRKLRAEYQKEYGQSTQLDVLNAKVDVNNDSINLLNTLQQLENAKRNLNLIMGRALDLDFSVDTMI